MRKNSRFFSPSELNEHLSLIRQNISEIKQSPAELLNKLNETMQFCEELIEQLASLGINFDPTRKFFMSFEALKIYLARLGKTQASVTQVLLFTRIILEILGDRRISKKIIALAQQLIQLIHCATDLSDLARQKIQHAQEYCNYVLDFLGEIEAKIPQQDRPAFLACKNNILHAKEHNELCSSFESLAKLVTKTRKICREDFIPTGQTPQNKYQRKARLFLELIMSKPDYQEIVLGEHAANLEFVRSWFLKPGNLEFFKLNLPHFLPDESRFQANRDIFADLFEELNQFIAKRHLPITIQQLLSPEISRGKTDAADVMLQHLSDNHDLQFFFGLRQQQARALNQTETRDWLTSRSSFAI